MVSLRLEVVGAVCVLLKHIDAICGDFLVFLVSFLCLITVPSNRLSFATTSAAARKMLFRAMITGVNFGLSFMLFLVIFKAGLSLILSRLAFRRSLLNTSI